MPVITCTVNCICIFGIFMLADDTTLGKFYDDEDESEDCDANFKDLIDDESNAISSVKLHQIFSGDGS